MMMTKHLYMIRVQEDMWTGCDLRGSRIIVCPDPDILVEVVGSQDGRVPSQVVKVIHDHGHEQIQHLNGHILHWYYDNGDQTNDVFKFKFCSLSSI